MSKVNVKDFLGVKKITKRATTTSNTNKSLKALISDDINKVIKERLISKWGEYFKCIEATSYAKGKDGTHEVITHNGWKLMIPTTYINHKGETYEGDVWSIGEPTLYIKGLKSTNESNFIFDFKETQKVTLDTKVEDTK